MNANKKKLNQLWLFNTFILMLLAFLCSCANAEPVPVFDFPQLLTNSDVIADVEPIGLIGQCRVLAILAGQGFRSGATITISTQDQNLLLAFKIRQHICVFLKRVTDKPITFVLADPYYSWFRIDSKLTQREMPIRDVVEAQLLVDLSSTNEAVVNDAIMWLDYFHSIKGQQEISRLTRTIHHSSPIYAASLVQLVPTGNHKVIQEALDFIINNKNNTVMAEWVWKVAYAFDSIHSTDDVFYLNHLLIQQQGEVSRWLVSSARHWANKSSVPYLMRALTQSDRQRRLMTSSVDDSDPGQAIEKEHSCISALSTITKHLGPGIDDFAKAPDKYYTEWQQWWKTMGHTEYGDVDENR